MREKYESLSVVVLKDLAKSRGIKNLSGMKKHDLVEAMLAEDEREKQEKGKPFEWGDCGTASVAPFFCCFRTALYKMFDDSCCPE